MFRTLIAKELLEQRRTSKLLVVVLVFFVAGMISPLLAKYTPQLLASIPNLPPGLAGVIPKPTVDDAVAQYIKNLSQFGVLLAILFTMGTVAQEKERGTLGMLLVKPVRRSTVMLAKWLAGVYSLVTGLVLSSLACLFYTWVLFEPLPLVKYLALNALLAVFLVVYHTMALLASTLARSQTMAAAGAFGALVAMLILDSIPRLGDLFPGELLSWGVALMIGEVRPAWGALATSLGIVLVAIFLACAFLEREEI
jgi:ABC-2 type transport system permease protein